MMEKFTRKDQQAAAKEVAQEAVTKFAFEENDNLKKREVGAVIIFE